MQVHDNAYNEILIFNFLEINVTSTIFDGMEYNVTCDAQFTDKQLKDDFKGAVLFAIIITSTFKVSHIIKSHSFS